LIGVVLSAALLARRNLRKGRGDSRGAARLSSVVFAVTLLAWIFGADHTPTQNELGQFFFVAVSQSLLSSGLMWLVYIALEPLVRRRWPETIISWSRVLGGELRDPLVGRDVLIGVVAGLVFATISPILVNLSRLFSGGTPNTGTADLSAWLGVRQLIADGMLAKLNVAIGFSLVLFFILFMFRALTRRGWFAAVLFTALFTLGPILGRVDSTILEAVLLAAFNLLTAVLIFRYGLLSMATAILVGGLIRAVPLTTDLSVWYAGYMITMIIIVLAIAGWAFHTSLGGQKLFTGDLLEGD